MRLSRFLVTWAGLFSSLVWPSPGSAQFLDAHNPPPAGWTGPVFKLRQDYPSGAPPAESNPWKQFDFKTQPLEYVQSVLQYCYQGNTDANVDWQVEKNQRRTWYHAPWMHDADAGLGQIGEVVNVFRIALAHEDDERRAIEDALARQLAPTLRRDDTVVTQTIRVELEREDGDLRGHAHDELVGDRAGACERTDEFDVLACLLLPHLLERGEDRFVHHVAQNAEAIDDDGARLCCLRRQRQPGPQRVQRERAQEQNRDERAQVCN